MRSYTTRWGAIRFTDGERAFCPVTAWSYAKTGRIFQVWQLYDAGKAISWTALKCFIIALLADVALIPFRRSCLRKLAPEVFAADLLEHV
jgi:hypothetical protein